MATTAIAFGLGALCLYVGLFYNSGMLDGLAYRGESVAPPRVIQALLISFGLSAIALAFVLTLFKHL